jgi:hypothetical protein
MFRRSVVSHSTQIVYPLSSVVLYFTLFWLYNIFRSIVIALFLACSSPVQSKINAVTNHHCLALKSGHSQLVTYLSPVLGLFLFLGQFCGLFFSLLSLFWKNKIRLMRSRCCLCAYPPQQLLNTWTNLYDTWCIHHGTCAHLNGLLCKSFPSVILTLQPLPKQNVHIAWTPIPILMKLGIVLFYWLHCAYTLFVISGTQIIMKGK